MYFPIQKWKPGKESFGIPWQNGTGKDYAAKGIVSVQEHPLVMALTFLAV
jgi:hypothetical protein